MNEQQHKQQRPSEYPGAESSPRLFERLKQYYAEHVGDLSELLERYQITDETQQAVLLDLWQRLSYKDSVLNATPRNIKELQDKIPDKELSAFFFTRTFPLFYSVFQDYARTLGALALADELTTFAGTLESADDQTDDQRQEVTDKGHLFELIYNGMSYTAQLQIQEYLPDNVILILKDGDDIKRAVRRYISFIDYAIQEVEATDEELLQVDAAAPLYLNDEIKAEAIGKIRAGIDEDRRKFEQAQQIDETARRPRPDVLPKDQPETTTNGHKVIKLWQNVVEACSAPLRMAKKKKADETPTGEEVTRPKPKAQPLGTYSLKTAIQRAQEEIDTEALIQHTTPIKLSEERIYQCLNGLQILANGYGQPVVTKDAVEYFAYETSLRKIAAVCYNNDKPNAELIRQTYESLRILSTNYVAFEEKRVKNVRIDTPDGQRITKPVTKTYRHYIQLVLMPQISLRTNPDGTENDDIGVATATIWVHSVLRTGRRQSGPVIHDGKKEYIQTPRQQYITYEQLQDSLRYFKSRDGSGRRFFSMLLAKNHKNEEDILNEVFDYAGKVEKAVNDAEKRAKKRIAKREKEQQAQEQKAQAVIQKFDPYAPFDPYAAYGRDLNKVANELQGIPSKEQEREQEIEKEKAAAEKKARRLNTKNKSRDRDTLVLWFGQAVELNVIEANPTRKASTSKPGTYVWEWTRAKTRKIEDTPHELIE